MARRAGRRSRDALGITPAVRQYNCTSLRTMPEGLANYTIGILILGLKIFLLPRCWPLPMFSAYILASIASSITFLSGWYAADSFTTMAVSLLAIGTAVESLAITYWLGSDDERSSLFKWCLCLGCLMVAVVAAADPTVYDGYSSISYLTRLYSGAFTVGWLVALLGYAFAVSPGVRAGMIHSAILLVRVFALTAILLVHNREHWYLADGIGGIANAATLAAWIGWNPIQAYAWSASRSARSRKVSPASPGVNH